MTDDNSGPTSGQWKDTQRRISESENRLGGIERALAGFGEKLSNQDEQLSGIREQLRSLTGKFTDSRAINWQTVLMIGSLGLATLTVMFVIGGLVVGPLIGDISKIQAKLDSHMDGHPNNVRDNVKRLELVVKDGLVSVNEASLVRDEHNLQNDIERFGAINDRLSALDDWTLEHDRRVIGLNASQWERIRALEREAYGVPGPVEYGATHGSGDNPSRAGR